MPDFSEMGNAWQENRRMLHFLIRNSLTKYTSVITKSVTKEQTFPE